MSKLPRFDHSRKEAAAIDKHNAALMQPRLPAKPNPVKAAKKYLEDYPEHYDATRDSLATSFDHAMSVNELLRHLRAVINNS